ncbi:hypothetical protein C789_2638 [Microcystis aeruginosa FACHB-905 = DIANCHI905]|uniref:Uncharacterized protein n=1 Tax=Microcystis aeruginosa PCC 7806SL TaxID=1903187 RepID=A0AB33BTI0_MICA7|nr:hypothetical protein BH695_3870 [Microcystis aeruginosa PCC 7806SL]ELS47522.1 hypothetical protein C789_2638 [Microcystis aeruginosa FACHB-905 = DIANCHI905]
MNYEVGKLSHHPITLSPQDPKTLTPQNPKTLSPYLLTTDS